MKQTHINRLRRAMIRLAALASVSSPFCGTAQAQSNSDAECTQCLNRGAVVLIENLKEVAKSYGLSQEQIKTIVELKLLRNGINLDHQEDRTVKPLVHVVLTCVEASETQSRLAFGLQVELEDVVFPLSTIVAYYQPNAHVVNMNYADLAKERRYAAVWSKASVGYVGRSMLPNKVYDSLNESLDQMMRDYLLGKQNAKQK
jgi:hypothetical protein